MKEPDTLDVIKRVLKKAKERNCEAEVIFDALHEMKKRSYISVMEAILTPTKTWIKK